MVSRRSVLVGGGAALCGLAAHGAWQLRQGGYEDVLAEMGRPLPEAPQVADLLRYATLAANGHNSQPWRFRPGTEGVEILADVSRRTPVVDPDDHHLYASLGCAAENLSIAARSRGLGGAVENGEVLRVHLAPGVAEAQPLLPVIPARQSTRGAFDGSRLTADQVARLVSAAAQHDVEALWIEEAPLLQQVAGLILEGNARQMADPAFMRELKAWVRFNPVEAAATGDGLFSASSGNPSVPSWLGGLVFDLAVTAKGENAKYRRQIDSSAGVLVLVAPKDTPRGWVQAGRACQRLMLQATLDGLKCAFVNQAVEVPEMRRQLQSVLGLGDRRPNLVLRVGRGPALPRSLRRPAKAVLAA